MPIIGDHGLLGEDRAPLLNELHIFYIGEIRHSLIAHFIINANMLDD